MSSTRRASPGSPLSEHGYASDPIYASARGINATAAAAKAELLCSPVKRSLIYFLQSLSLRDGGVRRIAKEILDRYPERIGTKTMLSQRIKPGQKLDEKTKVKICRELGYLDTVESLNADRHLDMERYDSGSLIDTCQQRAHRLHEFISELTTNPRLEIVLPGESEEQAATDREQLWELAGGASGFEQAYLPHFPSIIETLFEYQRTYNEEAEKNFAMTSVGNIVFDALNYAIKTRKMVLIRGNSGVGKSTSACAWADMRRDRVRYLSLKGINNRTTFFRSLAGALGVADGLSYSPSKIQARCEAFLEKTRCPLVIDEGQYLWPQGERATSHPELINWLLTACYNESIPVAILATAEFDRRKGLVEKNSRWNSDQLARRIGRVFELPTEPTDNDLRIVTKQHLPDATPLMVKKIVGYSKLSQRFLPAIGDVITDARLVAEEHGREEITESDILEALNIRDQSDTALRREPIQQSRRRSARIITPAAALPERGRTPADDEFCPAHQTRQTTVNA